MESTSFELSDAPYPGLRPFRSHEVDIFFGRERQVDELLARLADHRFLAVVGPSGCGKSSLVAAGLMPALNTGFMATAGAHWRTAKFRPGERPLQRLAKALLDARILDQERAAQPDAQVFLEAALRRGPLGMVEILRSSALEPDVNLLVVVDQFEELFRFSGGVQRDDAEAFVALLLASAAASGERLYIAITMRSDFLGECAQFHGLPEAINDGLYLTPRLTREECAACITGPARVFQADVEPELVNRLLNDFGPDPDQLPLLQHALLRMWCRHAEDPALSAKTVLRVEDYEAIGGLARSLSRHADEALQELDSDHQRIAKVMFQRLSDSETAKRDRRSPAYVQEIAELAGVEVDDVRQVADVFRRRDRCFLMPREGVPLVPETVLDVSHESLLRQWSRAVGWIEEEAEFLVAYRRLKDAARSWRDGEALLAAASLERAITWRDHASVAWARRYGPDQDYRAVCDLIDASIAARDAANTKRQRARVTQLRRVVATVALGGLAVAIVIAWAVRPLLYVWEHTSYYASRTKQFGVPGGLGELTAEQVRHRPLSYRVVTAGLLGPVKRMEVVNSRNELTEVAPDYRGTERGRRLATSRWVYEYDASGRLASELQYTRFDELVQGKIYVPRAHGGSRQAVFLGADATPAPVQGRTVESTYGSVYYWVEELHYTNSDHHTEITAYLGLSGEPATNSDHAFATQRTYDERGYEISFTSLDRSGHPMNDAVGNATFLIKRDESGNETESIALDDKGRKIKTIEGWAISRTRTDPFGNDLEVSYFDENDQPILIKEGWHKLRLKRDNHGNIVERRYFDRTGKPTTDAEFRCYGAMEQHDLMDRLIRSTCIDANGASRKNRQGFVTEETRFDDRGQLREESTLDAGGRLTAGRDAVAVKQYDYDQSGREIEITHLGADATIVTNADGYAKSLISYEDASRTEWVQYFDVDGKPVTGQEGYASVKRKRDIFWNVIEEHYYDEHGDAKNTSDGSVGWRGTYNANGEKISWMFLDRGDQVMLCKDGYAGQRLRYDDLGRTIAIHYLDPMGNSAVNLVDGVAGWTSQYDTWGRETERRYFGLDGNLTHSIHGDAGWSATYDDNQTSRWYIDTSGGLALHAWADGDHFTGSGYAGLKQRFDEHGLLSEVAYFGLDTERIAPPGGWSFKMTTYDDLGRSIRESFYGIHGEPVEFDGYHALTWRKDFHDNAMEIRYFGVDGKTPTLSVKGSAHIVYIRDLHGNLTEERLLGIHDEPVATLNGVHRTVMERDRQGRTIREVQWGPGVPPKKLGAIEFRYDDWGNKKEERHLDANDQPVDVLPNERCGTTQWEYNDRQELLDEKCISRNGTLTPLLREHAAHIKYEYGQPGKKIAERYFDWRDKPFTTTSGFAGIKYKYDAHGNGTETDYINTNGEQTQTTLGYARTTQVLDSRGNRIEQAFFLADDSPLRPVARIEFEFDNLGRMTKERYLGPGGKPAQLAGDGQNATVYEYDVYGNVAFLHYLDARGNPTYGYARNRDSSWRRCGRWDVHYDVESQAEVGECQTSLVTNSQLGHFSAERTGAARAARSHSDREFGQHRKPGSDQSNYVPVEIRFSMVKRSVRPSRWSPRLLTIWQASRSAALTAGSRGFS